jgi:hypothetical protein
VTTDGTFRCEGCARRRAQRFRHESGFCTGCIARGRSFWLRTLGLEGALELAREVFAEEERLAA